MVIISQDTCFLKNQSSLVYHQYVLVLLSYLVLLGNLSLQGSLLCLHIFNLAIDGGKASFPLVRPAPALPLAHLSSVESKVFRVLLLQRLYHLRRSRSSYAMLAPMLIASRNSSFSSLRWLQHTPRLSLESIIRAWAFSTSAKRKRRAPNSLNLLINF